MHSEFDSKESSGQWSTHATFEYLKPCMQLVHVESEQ